MRKKYNVAVVGATGNTGHEVLKILAERNFPIESIVAVASASSMGKSVSFGDDKILEVKRIESVDFSKIDICFMCAGSGVSKNYAEKISEKGCIVIDKTSLFRMDKDVPLLVPEINKNSLNRVNKGIISNPNCVAIPLALALFPLKKLAKIKRVVVSTYQSVSGAGRSAINTLYEEMKASFFGGFSIGASVFPKSIAGNVIPMIGDLLDNGWTDEEYKISREVNRILNDDIKLSVTSVRVPVYIGHGISVACEFDRAVTPSEAKAVWSKMSGVIILNSDEKFVTPVEAQGEDDVFISRIRQDINSDNGLLFWVVSDNLRKGAALNGVQIAELLIKKDPSLETFKRN